MHAVDKVKDSRQLARSLEALRAQSNPSARDLVALLQVAVEGGNGTVARAAFDLRDQWGRKRGRALPPHVAALGIRAYHLAGRFREARELFGVSRAADPAFPHWDTLARLLETEPQPDRLASLNAVLDGGDTAAARAMVEDWITSEAPDWTAVAVASHRLEDPVTVLLAEDGLGLDLWQRGFVDVMPRPLVDACISARFRLGFLREAADLSASMAAREPAVVVWQVRRCSALLKVGDLAKAYDVASALWSTGKPAGVVALAQCLVGIGDLDRLDDLLAEAEAGWRWANKTPLRRAQFLGRTARGDFAGASELAADGDVIELVRRRVQAARDASDTRALNALLDQMLVWQQTPERHGDLRVVGPVVLHAHHQILKSWPRIEPLANWLSTVPGLLPRSVERLAATLDQCGRTTESMALLRSALDVYPRSPDLWLALVASEQQASLDDQAAKTRQAMREALPTRVYLHSLALANPKLWNVDEVSTIFEYITSYKSPYLLDKISKGLRFARIDLGTLDNLTKIDGVSPEICAILEMLQAQARDYELLEDATAAPVPFEAFRINRNIGRQRVAAALAAVRCVRPGPLTDATVYRATCLKLLDAMRDQFPDILIDTADSYAEALDLARFILRRIRSKTPTSVLRLGDGEGSFLPPAPEIAAEIGRSRDKVLSVWWGERRPEPEILEQMAADHLAAVHGATVVGVIPAWRFVDTSSTNVVSMGIYNCLAYVVAQPPQALITSAHLHHDLHAWNLWREIFAETRTVSWISCHDMHDYLARTWGIATRKGVEIPGEDSYFGKFGRYGDGRNGDDSLFDRHDEVRAALDPEPGEVWLVAAGFLGKIYCEDIRRRGGIALDIGSLADHWMGYATRVDPLEDPIGVNLTNALITDHGMPEPDEIQRILGPSDRVHSSRTGRYNIADLVPAPTHPPGRRHLIQIVGHPRCASGFMAAAFAAHGLEIGHERLLRDGISSWMSVVRDDAVPYGDGVPPGTSFEHTLVHGRDPLEAIGSIMLENAVETSFDFRRQHILRARGDDIASYTTALERAVASYVGWYEIAFAIPGVLTICVEDSANAVPAILAKIGRTPQQDIGLDPPLFDEFEAGEDDDDQSSANVEHVRRLNTSARKFAREKPSVTAADLAAIDGGLRDRLAVICRRFGYREP
ncbi:hypothetical protein [Acuticoccus mangrovi]|uniref:Uncharacterized protein n=1 Tax=Acuticoccus mangrovi TaxID=2796142 RepID=A0A934MH94_9HYPH|nr:hypothetical protein [Acuticoccus mangrovi]MBJ3776710.1 hypothetical protein [Acuticoccus mangrovi]